MVLSIETTMGHPKRGFVKLEDTVLVTDKGYEAWATGAAGAPGQVRRGRYSRVTRRDMVNTEHRKCFT